MNTVTEALYLVAAALFILALRWMSQPETARRAVASAVTGMLLAVGGTLLNPEIVSYRWIAVGGRCRHAPRRAPRAGAAHGRPRADGLSQAFGGLAAGLVGTAKYYLWLSEGQLTHFRMAVVAGEVILGCLTATGGLLAAAKLAEWMTTRPVTYRGQNVVSFLLLDCRAARRLADDRPDAVLGLPNRHRPGHGLRRAPDPPDRRRRHADRDFVPQLLRRPLGRRHGLRPGEQAAHHRRRARRLVGLHPVSHHVQSDEPVGDQRAVRRVRTVQAETATPNSGPSRAPPRPTRPSCSPTPTAWSSSPATAWPWPRRSIACAISTTS